MRDYARIRPLTLDERAVRILALAGVHQGQFDFVLLQLSRAATLRILIQAELAATAQKYTTTPELSTNHPICESEAPEFAPSIDIQLEHLVRPVLLTDITTNAPILTEIDSISETVPNSLIRHQKGHNSDLNLEKPVPPLVFGNYSFDPGRHSHTYSTLSALPSDVPSYPSLTDNTPCRELIGSWGRRPCQPGACSVNTNPVMSKAKSQPVSTVTRRPSTPAVPYTSSRKTSTLRVLPVSNGSQHTNTNHTNYSYYRNHTY